MSVVRRNHIRNIAIRLSSLYANVLHSSPYPRAIGLTTATYLYSRTGGAIVRHNRGVEMILQKTRKAIGEFISPLVNQLESRCAIFFHSSPTLLLFRSAYLVDNSYFCGNTRRHTRQQRDRKNILCTFLLGVC